MTITLNPTSELEQALERQAQTKGLSLEEFILALIEQSVKPASPHISAEEFRRRTQTITERHGHGLPVLTNRQLSREAFYEDAY